MKNKNKKYLGILLGVLVAVVVVYFVSVDRELPEDMVVTDEDMLNTDIKATETIEHKTTFHLTDSGMDDFPTSYEVVVEEDGVHYKGTMELDGWSSQVYGEVLANYSGTLSRTDEPVEVGIKSVDVTIYLEEQIRDEIPDYRYEFEGNTFVGNVKFVEENGVTFYEGVLDLENNGTSS